MGTKIGLKVKAGSILASPGGGKKARVHSFIYKCLYDTMYIFLIIYVILASFANINIFIFIMYTFVS